MLQSGVPATDRDTHGMFKFEFAQGQLPEALHSNLLPICVLQIKEQFQYLARKLAFSSSMFVLALEPSH